MNESVSRRRPLSRHAHQGTHGVARQGSRSSSRSRTSGAGCLGQVGMAMVR